MKTTTTRVSFLLPSFLANEVKRTSKMKEITQSEIMKRALENWFNDKLRDDLEELSKIEFNDIPTIDEWISVRPNIN